MNKYCFTLKPIESSMKYGSREINIIIKDHNVYYARKNIQFQYLDYKILKVVGANERN